MNDFTCELQFRPMLPAGPVQQPHQFVSAASPQFRPVGQPLPPANVGIPSCQTQPPSFPQLMQQMPPRLVQPGPGSAPSSSQAGPVGYIPSNMPISSGSMLPQQTVQPLSNPPIIGGVGMPLSSSYTVRLIYNCCPMNLLFPLSHSILVSHAFFFLVHVFCSCAVCIILWYATKQCQWSISVSANITDANT